MKKPIYEKSLHPTDKTKKHWRKKRTKPYEVGDRVGFKLFGDEIKFFDDAKLQRVGEGGSKTYPFMSELLSLTVSWTKAQIDAGNKPFAPFGKENVVFRGCIIRDQRFCDDLNWLYDYVNSMRDPNYAKSYERILQNAVMMGIRLMWEYTIVTKNIPLKGDYTEKQ